MSNFHLGRSVLFRFSFLTFLFGFSFGGCNGKPLKEKGGEENSNIEIKFLPLPGVREKAPLKLIFESNSSEGSLIYSLDGADPLPGKSKSYSGNLTLDSSCVVKVRQVSSSGLSPIFTGTYIFSETKSSVAIVSLSANPDSLFHSEKGLYSNYRSNAFIPATFEYFVEDGQIQLNKNITLRIAGGTSRVFPKKSFKIETPETDPFRYRFFSSETYDTFQGLMLRADATSGLGESKKNVAGERLHNEMPWFINQHMGRNVEMQAWKSVNLYINGKYWGLYTLMESKGAELIRNRFGLSDFDLLEGNEPVELQGDALKYRAFVNLINNFDPDEDDFASMVKSKIEVNSLFDAWIIQSWAGNFDFEVNLRFWRPRTANAKFRWIIFDFDAFGYVDDVVISEVLDNEKAFGIFILGRILQNQELRDSFLRRLVWAVNGPLSEKSILTGLDSIQSLYGDELNHDRKRWEQQMPYCQPGEQVQQMKVFAAKRGLNILNEAATFFILPAAVSVKIVSMPANTCQIAIDGQPCPQLPIQGYFIPGISYPISAIPAKGYRFNNWEGEVGENLQNSLFIPTKNGELKMLCAQ